MATIIKTYDGDILDSLCYAHYGVRPGIIEAVLSANPGLSNITQPYPGGITIQLPDLPAPTRESVTLWE